MSFLLPIIVPYIVQLVENYWEAMWKSEKWSAAKGMENVKLVLILFSIPKNKILLSFYLSFKPNTSSN